MASVAQVLLPLLCLALTQAQPHMPIYDMSAQDPIVRPNTDRAKNHRPNHRDMNYNNRYNSWSQHYWNSDHNPLSAEMEQKPYFDPFFTGDTYYPGGLWDPMPGINNVFNLPSVPGNLHRHLPPHGGNNKEVKTKVNNDVKSEQKLEKPKETPPVTEKSTKEDKDPKPDDAKDVGMKISEQLPPKTNEVKKDDDGKDKDKKDVDLNKKKDFLLVGQGADGNNIYLLHENTPNPGVVYTPNTNQAGNNVVYVPYNPGQTSNPVYQIVSGQPVPAANNNQVSPDKINTNDYSNAVPNSVQNVQPAVTLDSGTQNSQNPSYVTIYSNGQLIQIPGVVVNTAQNNVPVQNGNAVQGTSYILANTVPSNVQTVPASQNPSSNVIYAAVPNQPSNGPIYIQMPSCMANMPNNDAQMVVQNPVNTATNGLPSNVVLYQPSPAVQPVATDASNSYVQPNQVVTVPIQGPVIGNQNPTVTYQPAVQVPVSTSSNTYSQPITSTLGQNGDNQGVSVPVSTGTTVYNQPIVTSQRQEINVPSDSDKNTAVQPTVQMSGNIGGNTYEPIVSNNPIVNVESRGKSPTDQNADSVAVSSGTHGYVQPSVANAGDKRNNAIVNTPEVVIQANSPEPVVLDSNELSSIGAQPAVLIADFKDKKAKKKNKDSKEKKIKEGKKEKKGKEGEKHKVREPFTNKKKD